MINLKTPLEREYSNKFLSVFEANFKWFFFKKSKNTDFWLFSLIFLIKNKRPEKMTLWVIFKDYRMVPLFLGFGRLVLSLDLNFLYFKKVKVLT